MWLQKSGLLRISVYLSKREILSDFSSLFKSICALVSANAILCSIDSVDIFNNWKEWSKGIIINYGFYDNDDSYLV